MYLDFSVIIYVLIFDIIVFVFFSFIVYCRLSLLFVTTFSLGFDATDQRWIGAWWLGFIIAVAGFLIIAIPLFGYPKFLPCKL